MYSLQDPVRPGLAPRSRALLPIVASMLCCVLLAGCGGDGDDAVSSSGAPSDPGNPTPSATLKCAP